MAEDFELTILIRAIDEASSALDAVASRLAEDFAGISSEATAAGTELDRSLSSVVPIADEIDSAVQALGASLSQTSVEATTLSDSLAGLQRTATELGSIQGELASFETGGAPAGFGNDFGLGAGLGLTDLLDISRQQLDTMNQWLSSMGGGSFGPQLIQNNTFSGAFDSGSILDLLLPELERAMARGTTLLSDY